MGSGGKDRAESLHGIVAEGGGRGRGRGNDRSGRLDGEV